MYGTLALELLPGSSARSLLRPVGVAWASRTAGTLHCAGMASLLTGVVLVVALGLAAAAGIALLVGLFRVSGRRLG
jgi:hypothetical protein